MPPLLKTREAPPLAHRTAPQPPDGMFRTANYTAVCDLIDAQRALTAAPHRSRHATQKTAGHDVEPRARARRKLGSVHSVGAALDLHTYEPDKLHVTFPALGRRLDWVLVSRDFEFARHQVLAESLSDHQAVIAELSLRRSSSIATAAGRASRLG